MTGRLPALLLLAAAVCAAPAAAPPATALADDKPKADGKIANDPNAPLPIRVNQAIDSGVAWLKTKQFSNLGNWDPEITGNSKYDPTSNAPPFIHPTGCTSLALYTLLKCGVPPDDPAIKKGFDWLAKRSGAIAKGGKSVAFRVPNGTYELAVLALAIEAKGNPHKREKEREQDAKFRAKKGEKLKTAVKLEPADEAWLKEVLGALTKRRVGDRGWRYGIDVGQGKFHNGVRGDSDLSASNLAMLAILAGERCGIKQPDEFYAGVLRWTMGLQEPDGKDIPTQKRWEPSTNKEDEKYAATMDKVRGFGYLGTSGVDKENVASASMTACGLANLLICTTILELRESKNFDASLQARAEKSWWDGVAWLDYWWTMDRNTNGAQGYHYYYMYCLERACDLKRINLLAGHPWYNEGAQVLVDQQSQNGAWEKNDTHEPHDVLNTCFALLFLNRSTPAITGD